MQWSSCLLTETPFSTALSWLVFLINGCNFCIVYYSEPLNDSVNEETAESPDTENQNPK